MKRIKSMIYGYLAEYGIRNTIEICEYINNNSRDGTSVKSLGPILYRDPMFVNVGKERVRAIMGGSYPVKLWELRKDE